MTRLLLSSVALLSLTACVFPGDHGRDDRFRFRHVEVVQPAYQALDIRVGQGRRHSWHRSFRHHDNRGW